ncbi:CPBP family intramembrane metalloprotease [Bacillus pseudomycoides]|uniref:CPBP family intramembrane metalloprotease n=1 Tax=Bacillus pseudomycoides TaxID=64104 RepID=A0AA91VBC0_9BACI|nr:MULTISPECIES: CPBP family intramembrane glutamic endopeptidase [Bacillus]PEB51851.1 CPBP family intramembrane metalloprotease [Bacillus sp. AFS098217]PED81861.1 CPBP family intramembrane metalloprotease [Bacillus pseudomycoides]PEU15289.1 CPBP family intramembrane metalloprotease [Bacillus sp. AFS014408]PEU17892.1 CPBP family intramembrane metalloprotease [Bacillus sp. AFS019443]PFW63310.1 CPBP family intramembrane metalloprotease [Bacillus sp. AFS075034]
MSYLIALVLAVLLAFSYKIVDITVGVIIGRTLYRKIENEIIYIWGTLLTVIIYFYEDNYVFRLPIHYEPIVLLILIAAITNIFISRYSGYKPSGKKNILNFVIMYPIFEEVIFRGMIIPMLNNSFPIYPLYEIFYIPVTVQILISSFLFAVAHLQYYSFNQTSIKFMLFAFFGGIIFGMITDYSLSIVFSIFLHVEFNLLSVYYSKKSTAN